MCCPRRLAASLALLLTLAPPPATAAPKQQAAADELAYTPPTGWDRTEQERLVIFTPPKTPPTKCALIVTPGEKLEGDFLKWFKAKWDALRKDGKVVQGGERTALDGPGGSGALVQAALVESEGPDASKKRTGLLLYAVNIESTVYWVVFRTAGPDLFNEHKKTVNQFLAGMKFIRTAETTGKRPGERGRSAPAPGKRAASGQRAE